MIVCNLSDNNLVSGSSCLLIFVLFTTRLFHISQSHSIPLFHLAQRVPESRSAYESRTVTNFPRISVARSHFVKCPCILGVRAETNLSSVPVPHIQKASVDIMIISASNYNKSERLYSKSPSLHSFPTAFRRNIPFEQFHTSRHPPRTAVALADPFHVSVHARLVVVLRLNGVRTSCDVSIIIHETRLSCPDVLPASAPSSASSSKNVFADSFRLDQTKTTADTGAILTSTKTTLRSPLVYRSFLSSPATAKRSLNLNDLNQQSYQSRLPDSSHEQGTPRIVGGHPADQSHRPYMAAFTSGSRFLCSGSLISPRWIVTAAHCRISQSTQVTLGAAQLPDGDKFSVETVIRHPMFVEEVDSPYDVALVRLSSPASSSNIHPLLINANASHPAPKSYARVAGYGQTSEIARFDSLLRQVDVPIVAMDDCRLRYRSANTNLADKLSDHWQICAGLDEGGCDACHGDSGGPLFTVDSPSANAVLVGVVSFGIGCARAFLPGVYARTSSFVPWFREVGAEFTVQNGTHFEETYVSKEPGSRSRFSIAGLSPLSSIIIICVAAVSAAALVAALLSAFGIPRGRQPNSPDPDGGAHASGRSSCTEASWGTPREEMTTSNDICDPSDNTQAHNAENDEEAIMVRLARWRREQGSSSSAYDTSEYFTPSEGTTCINMDDESFNRLVQWRENAAEAKEKNVIEEPPVTDQSP